MMPNTHVVIGSLGVLVALVVGVVAFFVITNQANLTNSASQKASSLIDTPTLDSLDTESRSQVSTQHLARGVNPPTNKWYSGMVLNDEPKPGFNVPNSILLHNDGFELGLPNITTTSEGIYGPHVNGIQLVIDEATNYKLTRYDELTMTLAYYNEPGDELFEVTFASGSPYGFMVAKRDVRVSLKSGSVQDVANGTTTFKNGSAWYGVKTSNGKMGEDITLQKNDELAAFSSQERADITPLAKVANNRVISGELRYSQQSSRAKTTLSYTTEKNSKTILVRMPHQGTQNNRPAMQYPSLYGDLPAYTSTEIEYATPIEQLKWSLDLSNISANQKAVLAEQLQSDIANSKLDKNDTYFGGKQLQRLAQLVVTADSLNEAELRKEALTKLTVALGAWFDDEAEKSFYYDNQAKTIVGREASFGSDTELNDHHFHYGYFIYAASVAAKFDDTFLEKYNDDVNLLVADIANYKTGESLAQRRNFDAYAGHSWASGIANYADGNNQESSGEAINAWTAAGLWADVTDNNALKDEAVWLLSNEVVSAESYWLKKPTDRAYTAPLVSINWGGKREYKTFFSNEANAKLAIQLLPLNPTMKSYVDGLPKSIFENTDTGKQYGDYVFMAQGKKDLESVMDFPESLIDDGNSKTYLMAYMLVK